MSPPVCNARGCDDPAQHAVLMCARHWNMVPAGLQRSIWAVYTPGQERGLATPSPEWMALAAGAMQAVAIKERKQPKQRRPT